VAAAAVVLTALASWAMLAIWTFPNATFSAIEREVMFLV
jgi:hypothetical protein